MTLAPVSLRYRPDLQRIANWVQPGSNVLDLGCGDGKLLAYLRHSKRVRGMGVERDPNAVVSSIQRGVDVIQQDLEERSEERRVGKGGRSGASRRASKNER